MPDVAVDVTVYTFDVDGTGGIGTGRTEYAEVAFYLAWADATRLMERLATEERVVIPVPITALRLVRKAGSVLPSSK